MQDSQALNFMLPLKAYIYNMCDHKGRAGILFTSTFVIISNKGDRKMAGADTELISKISGLLAGLSTALHISFHYKCC